MIIEYNFNDDGSPRIRFSKPKYLNICGFILYSKKSYVICGDYSSNFGGILEIFLNSSIPKIMNHLDSVDLKVKHHMIYKNEEMNKEKHSKISLIKYLWEIWRK